MERTSGQETEQWRGMEFEKRDKRNINMLFGSSEILCLALDGSFAMFWAHRTVCNVKLKDGVCSEQKEQEDPGALEAGVTHSGV